jgi:uncharacterized GH25 family protein
MIKKISLVLGIMLGIMPLFAHEFWLSVDNYRVKKGDKISVSFLAGEGFKGDKWASRGKRLEKFLVHSPQGVNELSNLAKTDTSHSNIQISLNENGTHLLSMTSLNSFIELDGEKFNAYLQEDGISEVYEQRAKSNQLNTPAREFYSRCAKTLVQVGDKPSKNFKKIVGMPLEIIPLQNPYAKKIGEKLECKILFKNKPLANASVKIWHRPGKEAVKPTDIKSDANGKISLVLNSKGEYMISLVKMIPYTNTQEADYQSYWATLTFGL